MVIASGNVPGTPAYAHLRRGEYIVTRRAVDKAREDGVELDVEVADESSTSQEDLGLVQESQEDLTDPDKV